MPPEMLRIDDEVNSLITSIQLNLRLRNDGFHISKIDVVQRALQDMAAEMNVPRLKEDDCIDDDV